MCQTGQNTQLAEAVWQAWIKKNKTQDNRVRRMIAMAARHEMLFTEVRTVIYHRPRFCGWGPSFEAGDFASSTFTVRPL